MRFTGDDALMLMSILFFVFCVVLVVGWWLVLTIAFCEVAGAFWGELFGAVTAVCGLLGIVFVKSASE